MKLKHTCARLFIALAWIAFALLVALLLLYDLLFLGILPL
jgi:hypothetical protein